MVQITDTTVLSNSWRTIYQLITDQVIDPAGRASGTRWIVFSFPDLRGSNFPGFPIIVIEGPEFEFENAEFGAKFREGTLRFDITIYSKVSSQLNTLGDSILTALSSNANQGTTEEAGIFNPKFSFGTIGAEILGKNKIKFRTISVSYFYKGAI